MCELVLDCSITKLGPVALRVFQPDRLFLFIHLYQHTAYGWNLRKLFFQLKCQGWQTVFSLSLTEYLVPQQAISCPHFPLPPKVVLQFRGVWKARAVCVCWFFLPLDKPNDLERAKGQCFCLEGLGRVTADGCPFPGHYKTHDIPGLSIKLSGQTDLPATWSGKGEKINDEKP